MTNGLSPLMQAAVGGKTQTIPGQNIIKDGDNFYYATGGEDQIYLEDPDNILKVDGNGYVIDNDYIVEESEDGLIVKGIKGETGSDEMPEEEMPVEQGPMGGVGETPMEMRSPYKNYRNPQDYKVFNWGNKPTPFEKRKKY